MIRAAAYGAVACLAAILSLEPRKSYIDMPIKPGSYPCSELASLARVAHADSGLTQVAASKRLGVSPPAYAQALAARPGLDVLRRRIIEEFSDLMVSDPVVIVTVREEERGTLSEGADGPRNGAEA